MLEGTFLKISVSTSTQVEQHPCSESLCAAVHTPVLVLPISVKGWIGVI